MQLKQELQNRFGFPEFRPGQEALIDAILRGRDALGVMPTGGGKSLCFQLPAAVLDGMAVVVSPLIALMKDQVDALRVRGIPAEAYNSTLSAGDRRRVRDRVARGELKLLYIAPERVQNEEFMEFLGGAKISFLAIDEAHCISHWGHDFRPDYRRLGELRQQLLKTHSEKRLAVIALTATATQRVQVDIQERLGMKEPVSIITGFRRPNLAFAVRKCSNRAEKFRVMKEVIDEALGEAGSAVIYASTRKNVELVADHLRASLGARVGFYHAGLSDEDRKESQEAFLRDQTRVLVATNAFGMGIDKPTVRAVIHYDIPGSVEAYYQEAGRAGRDGKPAQAVLLFNHADIGMQEFFIRKTSTDGLEEESREAVAARIEQQEGLLKQLVRYAYATSCRQKLVLGYFGDPEARKFVGCERCDICAPRAKVMTQVEPFLALVVRQVLNASIRVSRRFGKGKFCEMLKGSANAAFMSSGLQNHPDYGVLRDWPLVRIKELVEQLCEDGYLKVEGLDYPVLVIAQSGIQVAYGKAPVALSREVAGPETAAPTRTAAPTQTASSQERMGRPQNSSAPEEEREAPGPPPDPVLLSALKTFRREEAQKQKIPPYCIFHDKTLAEIASRKPTALDSLSRVPGIGPKKLTQYGERILSLIASS